MHAGPLRCLRPLPLLVVVILLRLLLVGDVIDQKVPYTEEVMEAVLVIRLDMSVLNGR